MAVEVPNKWQKMSLGDLVDIKRGISWSNDQEVPEGTVNAYPVLGIPNVQAKLELSDIRFINGVDPKKAQTVLAKKGWALMVGSNGNPKRVGNCVYIDETGSYLFASFLLGLHPIDGKILQSEYMFRLLCSGPIQKSISDSVQGSTGLKNISVKMLRDEQVLLPPLPEQKKIAEILESVDDAIAKTEAVIAQTERVKQGLLQQLLTRGIGHTKFKQSPLGEIPESWEVVSLGELQKSDDITGIQDGNHGAIHPKASDYVDEGIPFVMARDLVDGSVCLDTCAYLPKELADSLRIGFSLPGDILLTHKGTMGIVAETPKVPHYVMLTPQVTYYRVNPKGRLLSQYLKCFFEGQEFQSRISSLSEQSTRSYLGITEQKKLLLTLPSIKEQAAIVSSVQSFKNSLISLKNELDILCKLKKALMSDLLSGRVRVNIDTTPITQTEVAA